MKTSERSTSRVLLIAACFGLCCGLAEGGIYWILSVVPDWIGWRNDLLPQILWIAPMANLLLFLGLSLPVMLLGRAVPSVRPDLFAYAVFGWLASYGPLAASAKLHPLTCVLIALGCTVQLYRFARGRRPVTTVLLGRGLATLSVLLALLSLAGAALGGQRTVPAVVRAAATQSARPNVLLITLDTLRADHLSAYGYGRPTTPTIDRLAREGVLFENAFAAASWTLPSHASIMTGRYPHEHRAGGRPLGGRYPTLAQVLSSRGYATAAFVANTHYVAPRTGLERGFSHFEAYYSSPTDMLRRTFYGRSLLDRLPLVGYYDIPGRKRATEVNREFFRWLDDNGTAPFFVFLNYFDVHDPYVPPKGYEARFSSHANRGSRINSEMSPGLFMPANAPKLSLSPEDIRVEIDGYDASLAYLDAELGSLFTQLGALGVLDNTLIIIASDHGESFGEHGLFGHGNSLYRNLIHVPLIIRFPNRVPAGLRVTRAASLQAIPATVMNLLGLDAESPFPGSSLVQHWADGRATVSDESDVAFAESVAELIPGRKGGAVKSLSSSVKSLSSSKWHMIVHSVGQVEVFRIEDAFELDNLVTTPEGAEAIRGLGSRMADLMPPADWKIFSEIVARGTAAQAH